MLGAVPFWLFVFFLLLMTLPAIAIGAAVGTLTGRLLNNRPQRSSANAVAGGLLFLVATLAGVYMPWWPVTFGSDGSTVTLHQFPYPATAGYAVAVSGPILGELMRYYRR